MLVSAIRPAMAHRAIRPDKSGDTDSTEFPNKVEGVTKSLIYSLVQLRTAILFSDPEDERIGDKEILCY